MLENMPHNAFKLYLYFSYLALQTCYYNFVFEVDVSDYKLTEQPLDQSKISHMSCLTKLDISYTYLAEDRVEFYANK